jgi:hypothetical protein
VPADRGNASSPGTADSRKTRKLHHPMSAPAGIAGRVDCPGPERARRWTRCAASRKMKTMNNMRMRDRQRQQDHGRGRARRAAVLTAAALAGCAAAVAGAGTAALAQPGAAVTGQARSAARQAAVSAGDSPAGFWYGTDSHTITISGSAPYREPVIGGAYGGYIGMIGNWARWQGCGGILVWSSENSRQASTDLSASHQGIGTGAYWFMAGPGVDPHYNGTTSEGISWGAAQAARMLADVKGSPVKYPVLFMDVELPGNAPDYTPAPDNGWNSVYTSPCSGRTKATFIPAAVDRAVFNGFFNYVTAHSSYTPGVYSAPSVWADIFGSGAAASIKNVHEWTYTGDTSSLVHHPAGWCLQGTSTCAQFFGGVTSGSSNAVMWQWSGGGGTDNGSGDFDQIDANRTP